MRRYVEHVMGMPISMALRGEQESGEAADDAWAQVMATLHDVDRVFSTYRPESVISRVGRGEMELTDCPAEVAEVLGLGEVARCASDGAFDVRRGGVLDPSGVVKGWAVERAARCLRHLAGTDFCLSAGGDLVAHVADPSRPAWQIGIEDPLDPARVLAVVPVRDGGVATSGTAHRGAHVVDARTGEPATALASVTVIASTLTAADLDATSAFALGVEGPAWLRGRPGTVSMVVWPDGRVDRIVGARQQIAQGACSV